MSTTGPVSPLPAIPPAVAPSFPACTPPLHPPPHHANTAAAAAAPCPAARPPLPARPRPHNGQQGGMQVIIDGAEHSHAEHGPHASLHAHSHPIEPAVHTYTPTPDRAPSHSHSLSVMQPMTTQQQQQLKPGRSSSDVGRSLPPSLLPPLGVSVSASSSQGVSPAASAPGSPTPTAFAAYASPPSMYSGPPELDPSSYSMLNLLGQGGYASVYRALYRGPLPLPLPCPPAATTHFPTAPCPPFPMHREVAVKVFDLEANWVAHMDRHQPDALSLSPRHHASRGQRRRSLHAVHLRYRMEEVWREVTLTARLRHPHICRFTHCFVGSSSDGNGIGSGEAGMSEIAPTSYDAHSHALAASPRGHSGALPFASPSPSPSAPSTPQHRAHEGTMPPPPSLHVGTQSPTPAPGLSPSPSLVPTGTACSPGTAFPPPIPGSGGVGDPHGGASFFVVMPLAEGSLRQMLSALYPLGIKDDTLLACLIAPILSALAYAHNASNGIVHRDVKLDNVLVDRHGQVLLADWGIAEEFWKGGGGGGGGGGERVAGAAGLGGGVEEEGSDSEGQGDEGRDEEEEGHEDEDVVGAPEHSFSRSAGTTAVGLSASSHPTGSPSRGHLSARSGLPLRGVGGGGKLAGTPLMMAPELLARAQAVSQIQQQQLHSFTNAATSAAVDPHSSSLHAQHMRHSSALSLPSSTALTDQQQLAHRVSRASSMATGSASAAAAAAAARFQTPGLTPQLSPSLGPLGSRRSAAATTMDIDSLPGSEWCHAFLARCAASPPGATRSFKAASSIAPKCDTWAVGVLALELAFGAAPHSSARVAAAASAIGGLGVLAGAGAHALDSHHGQHHIRKLILESPAPSVGSMAREFASQQLPLARTTPAALQGPWFGFSKSFHDFLGQALVKDPLKRASASQLLAHPWIKKYANGKTMVVPTPGEAGVSGGATTGTAPAAGGVGAVNAAGPLSPTRSSIPASPFFVPPPSTASAASAPLPSPGTGGGVGGSVGLVVHKHLYLHLLSPWSQFLRERRIREDRERKEAERLAKKASLSRAQQRAVQQAQDALRQGMMSIQQPPPSPQR